MSGTIVVDTVPAVIESGDSWNGLDHAPAPVIVTFSFPTSLPTYDDTIGGFTPETINSFSTFTAGEQAQAIAALNQWAAASGIIFLEAPVGQTGDITFANVNFNTTTVDPVNGDYRNAGGIGFYPFGYQDFFTDYNFTSDLSSSGAVFMNSQFINSGTVNLGTLLHEIGHAIGLKHPDKVLGTSADGVQHNDILDPAENSGTVTIMSEVGDGSGANATLFALDSLAAADLYGPAGTGEVVTSATTGANSVSTWSWDGTTLTQHAVSANETIHGTSVNDIIYGFDFGGTVATNGTISLFGLDGTNTLFAGSGTTSLFGGPGTNTLVGGAGDDTFYVYSQQTTVEDAYTTDNTIIATGVDFTLPANVDTLYLFGNGLTGTGNGQEHAIFGDGQYSNTLVAGSGSAYMVGGGGGNKLVAGTGIDQMYGGLGANIFVFAPGDAPVGDPFTIDFIGDFKPGTDKLDFSAFAAAGHALRFIGTAALTAPGQVNETISAGYTYIRADVTSQGSADLEIQLKNSLTLQAGDFIFGTAPCYAAGTLIMTDRGEVAVEALTAGDQVITVSGVSRPVRWIGHRRIECSRHPDPRMVWPVCITAGAFGEALPHRDLWLSPDHAVFVDGVLVPIKLLINHATISQMPVNAVTYYHVELAQHDVLLAEGLPAESYLDTGNRDMFENAGAPLLLHPFMEPQNDQARREAESCAPFVCQAEMVEPIWHLLAARAEALGFAPPLVETSNDPLLCIRVGDKDFRPVSRSENRYQFLIPRGRDDARLVSRHSVPSDARPWVDDPRRLGVAIRRIAVWRDGQCNDIALDDPRLSEGWWEPERNNAAMWRWTDGNAALPVWGDRLRVEIVVSGAVPYPVTEHRCETSRAAA